MRKMKVGELVEDFSIYPRASVDAQHIASIATAIKCGTEMPPIVIEKVTKRIVDGVHRKRAYERVHGACFDVAVVEKTYQSEQELLKDAGRYNARHGRNLTTFDRAHFAILAINLHVPVPEIAQVLNVSSEYVSGTLLVDRSAFSGSLHVPIKSAIRHMAGKTLTDEQVEANKKIGGNSALYFVNQLKLLIENDLLDTKNEKLMEALRQLGPMIDGVCGAPT